MAAKLRMILSISLLGVVLSAGCIEYGPPGDPKVIPQAITLLISSETTSNFTPCGCAHGKWGGLPRRGTIFTEVEDEVEWDIVTLDTGNVAQGALNEIYQTKNNYIFQAYRVIDYDVVNVGFNDLKIGYEEMVRVQLENDVPWTSANTYAPEIFPDLPPGSLAPPPGTATNAPGVTGNPPNINRGDNPSPDLPDNPPEQPVTEPAPLQPSDPDAEPLFQPYRIVDDLENAPGYKIGFIGMMIQDGGRLNGADGFSFEPYTDAIRRTVQILRQDELVDLVVLLCDADSLMNYDTATLFEGIDIIIGGNTRVDPSPNATLNPLNPLHRPDPLYQRQQEQLNPAEEPAGTEEEVPGEEGATEDEESEPEIVLEPLELPLIFPKAGGRGRTVTRLDLTFDAGGRIVDYYTEEIEVSDAHIDDPRMAEIARGFDTDVLSQELTNRLGRIWSGSAACAECHPGFLEAWSEHGHFHAYETIELEESLEDRECTRCHAIGFMEEPRLLTYDLIPENMRNVGCEGCHPTGQRHISLHEGLMARSPELRATATAPDSMAEEINVGTCTKCHTGEFAQGFDFIAAMDEGRSICLSVVPPPVQ